MGMMEIEGEYRLSAPRELVWELLFDPTILRASIPGCERLVEVGPGAYEIEMKVGIAAIRGAYAGKVTVADPKPHESYRLVIAGNGAPGNAGGEATLTLSGDAAATVVRYRASFSAQGGLARLGGRLLTGSAAMLAGQFFKAIEKQVSQRVV
jgi:hypothetical protein